MSDHQRISIEHAHAPRVMDMSAAQSEEIRIRAIEDLAREIQAIGRTKGPQCDENRRPMKCAIALVMLAEATPLRKISESVGMSIPTIMRLSRELQGAFSEKRELFARAMAEVAVKARTALSERLDMMLEDPEDLKSARLNDLAVVVGITHDKTMALSGVASTVIEHRTGPTIEDAAKEISAARARAAARIHESSVEAEIVEVV